MDALAIALDEVALEGLDGITVSSLWIRLESRQPPFPLTLDAMTREFVWRFLVSCEDEVSFYLLAQDRPPVTLYDRSVLLILIKITSVTSESQIEPYSLQKCTT